MSPNRQYSNKRPRLLESDDGGNAADNYWSSSRHLDTPISNHISVPSNSLTTWEAPENMMDSVHRGRDLVHDLNAVQGCIDFGYNPIQYLNANFLSLSGSGWDANHLQSVVSYPEGLNMTSYPMAIDGNGGQGIVLTSVTQPSGWEPSQIALNHSQGQFIYPESHDFSQANYQSPISTAFQVLRAPSMLSPTLHVPLLPESHQDVLALHPPRTTRQQTEQVTSSIRNTGLCDLESELVCFGMLIGITAAYQPHPSIRASTYAVKLESPTSFIGTQDSNLKGAVSPDFTFLTDPLFADADLQLQIVCSISEDVVKTANNGKRLRRSNLASGCSLEIILYGQNRRSDDVSLFIDECNKLLEDRPKLYLQDPVGCDRNVWYCNPQRLPPLDPTNRQYTQDLEQKCQSIIDLEDLEPPPELLEFLDSQEDLPEAPQPQAIVTPMKEHQKQALTFMLRREQGWAFDGTRPDIWEGEETEKGLRFTNRVSGDRQIHEPPDFYGGIIADPMGFGKTLAMISLVASDSQTIAQNHSISLHGVLGEDSCCLTLIIVPPALLGTWGEELEKHTDPQRMPWYLYHGKNRQKHAAELKNTMIVLTTYHTVSAEWQMAGTGRASSMLFAVRWRRLILDEAHYIRNSDSRIARAACALDSVSRWVVTGTPIQNHLNDLASLLKFLNVYPYNDKRVFDTDIAQLWKTGKPDEAVVRLKRLAGCLLLRRPRKTVILPPRHDHSCHVEFQPDERDLYNRIRSDTIAQIDEVLLQGSHSRGGFSSFSVLQQIVGMRLACNLGLFYPNRHDTSVLNVKRLVAQNSNQTAQSRFNLLFNEMGSITCNRCAFALDATYSPVNEIRATDALFSQCADFICPDCVREAAHNVSLIGCRHDPSCPMTSVSTSAASLETAPISVPIEQIAESGYLPIKVAALVEDLQTIQSNVKCVVFSTWTMTLDIVEVGLNQAGISVLRYDGKVPQKERQKVVARFRNDPSIRVLLLTLSCGAVGLTLTVASRAYLMEPTWNPTLEDQALARIHRMGQEKEVTTIRFCVRDSFEEVVVKNQKLKRELASILLTSGKPETNDLGRLENIRRLI